MKKNKFTRSGRQLAIWTVAGGLQCHGPLGIEVDYSSGVVDGWPSGSCHMYWRLKRSPSYMSSSHQLPPDGILSSSCEQLISLRRGTGGSEADIEG